MNFDDYVGSITTDLSHLRTFLNAWFRPDDLVTLVGIPTSGIRIVMSQVVSVKRLLAITTDEEFAGLTMIDDRKVNLYIATNPTKEVNGVVIDKSRGTKADVRDIYGCFVDLDVIKEGKKSGVFESKQEIFNFLGSFPLKPTMVIDNGSGGGIHAYWRLNDEDVPRATEGLLAAWWSFVSEQSPVQVDRLIDITRILRLPSGVYWPSNDTEKFDSVKVVYADGPTYSLDELMNISAAPYKKYVEKLAELKTQKTRVNVEKWNKRLSSKIAQNSPNISRELSERQYNILNQLIQSHIDDELSWQDILGPYGWTCLKVSDDGEETWARPGKNERSAVVNYVNGRGEVSGAMSLLSSSAETGISDLKEAGIPITKMQVLLRYKYDDDINEMIDDLYEKVVK